MAGRQDFARPFVVERNKGISAIYRPEGYLTINRRSVLQPSGVPIHTDEPARDTLKIASKAVESGHDLVTRTQHNPF